ncbi:MAG TPA: glycosyltransferase [Flavobacteriaceae bacterium]|nr:glycosyltransferase [Flavobacteriaceae bacterium]
MASYILLLLFLIVGFYRIKPFNTLLKNPNIEFSILIPFRNEAENLPRLLASILKIDYPKNLYEIIFIDDFSTDQSITLISKFIKENKFKNCCIIQNNITSTSPKKEAITLGVNKSKFKWIITTDADCILPKLWLQQYASFIIAKKPFFIAAPVLLISNKSFLNQFQQISFLSLIGSTIGSFGWQKSILCNGANLAYQKAVFNEIGGYTENKNIASGDDVFLLEKVKKHYPQKVSFLKSVNALVYTQAQSNLKDFVNQQIRWVSKSSKATNASIKIVGLVVLLGNLAFLITLFNANLFYSIGIYFLIAKLVLDFILIKLTSSFFNEKINLFSYLISSLIYPFYSIIISLIAPLFKYNWKGRKFKK